MKMGNRKEKRRRRRRRRRKAKNLLEEAKAWSKSNREEGNAA